MLGNAFRHRIDSPPKRVCSRISLLASAALAVSLAGGVTTSALADQPVDFNRDIRPLLSDRCFACHGPDAEQRQAGLRLDQEDAAKEWAIIPEDPEASEVVARINSDDPDMLMPPAELGKPLTEAEIDLLERWIAQGAAYAQPWAYVDPEWHALPQVDDPQWPHNWIDSFISSRLESEGIEPADDADAVALVRRLSFDLTGLPPDPQTVEQFVANPTEEAYGQLVDQLLGSNRFGERFAVMWLDLVRYADTVGYHGDQDHSIAPYRDWVIDSLNDNMPFDQFTREQLAGDLLEQPTIDQKIASGYNRLLQTSHEGGVQPKEYLAIYAADRVRNISAVWMGGTLGCAQCHDHKYDPYTARDFYSMAAFFSDIDEEQHFRVGSNALPTNRPPEIDVLRPIQRERMQQLEGRLAELRDRRDAIVKAAQPSTAPQNEIDSESTEGSNEESQISTPSEESERSAENDASAPPEGAAESESSAEPTPSPTPQLDAEIADVEQQIAAIEATRRKTMITVAKPEPRVTRILPRGNWLDDSGPIVQPAVPEFLERPVAPEQGRATRLDLANWLVDVEDGVGGLTARVMVNRLWAQLMGSGISPSLEDFGGQGHPPSHPQLLDNLSVEFYRNGWDIKHMLRLIVTSRTYRQSSVVDESLRKRDPTNRLFARQSRYRLPAEMIRDAALDIGDLLVLDSKGGSARPYQPAGYFRHLNFPPREYRSDRNANQYRRGVYVHWQRQFLHPMMKAFDAPSREECTAQRSRSNTPLAALVLLNDPTFIEASRGLAMRLLEDQSLASDAERIDRAFWLTVSRPADEFETQQLTESLEHYRDYFAADPDRADALMDVGLLDSEPWLQASPHDAAELAAWCEISRIVMNLSEGIVRP